MGQDRPTMPALSDRLLDHGAAPGVILITYTTLYREGGPRIELAARTLASERAAADPRAEIDCVRVECKRDFVDAVAAVAGRGRRIDELHFFGHSGMYGPMFGTRQLPEQFSPHEWRELDIPFSDTASARFHACRTGRWFAPFFARTFGVPAYGYHWYTTFSAHPKRFALPGNGPLYLVGCPGKKSHGLLGSLMKYSGLVELEQMRRFEPNEAHGDTYDDVAELYAEAYADIRVRRDEWRWLERHLPAGRPRLLDIGCGNGALLSQLADRLDEGRGVDLSAKMIELARARCRGQARLGFDRIDGPKLPYADGAFDIAVSFLSFRYLDWDPILAEIVRVVRPGGRLLVVDMVTWPLELGELPKFARSKARLLIDRRRNPRFAARLSALVRDPRWAEMLAHNPIRSQHEMKWYLESRFPGRRLEVLNVGFHNRVVAFDSGPIRADYVPPQSYP